MSGKWRIKLILGMALVLFVSGYAAYRLKDIVGGPNLTVTAPTTGATLAAPLVAIKGTTRRIDWLFLNGRQIFTDQEGVFAESLLLLPGYNIITLEGRDKFGRTVRQQLELILKS